MSIYAMIDENTNIVSNVIVLEEGAHWEAPAGVYMINIDGLEVGAGFTHNKETGEWAEPPESVTEEK